MSKGLFRKDRLFFFLPLEHRVRKGAVQDAAGKTG